RTGFIAPGCVVVHTVAEALRAVQDAEEVMVIGGGAIYKEFLPLAEKMYLTEIHREIEGDIYFPKFNRAEWIEEVRQDFGPNDENPYSYSFVVLNRLKVDKSS
ncbi:MAG TPA: dihydrofolate reductase, partial [Candidatus Paceibacterota bacterium]|nr:dihydrofolate reductase [Candidatus Paceibacterota bacterium]